MLLKGSVGEQIYNSQIKLTEITEAEGDYTGSTPTWNAKEGYMNFGDKECLAQWNRQRALDFAQHLLSCSGISR